jgi:hypothetical protein
MRSVDQNRALRILFDTYWTSSGWKKERSTPTADFEFARAAGVMFNPESLDHDAEIQRLIRARDGVTPVQVGNAFLASLGSRRLELRSALGSFAVARHMPAHWYTATGGSFTCSVCGRIRAIAQTHDLNVLNFERYKWGGVRHADPMYIAFDLEQFATAEVPVPAAEDLSLLRRILAMFGDAPVDSKLSAIDKRLAAMLKSNSAERRTLLGILGYAGLLKPNGRTGFFNEFTKWCNRTERPLNKDDWPYPIRWWSPQDGVNRQATRFWFPELEES